MRYATNVLGKWVSITIVCLLIVLSVFGMYYDVRQEYSEFNRACQQLDGKVVVRQGDFYCYSKLNVI
jgi:hypothetical protein